MFFQYENSAAVFFVFTVLLFFSNQKRNDFVLYFLQWFSEAHATNVSYDVDHCGCLFQKQAAAMGTGGCVLLAGLGIV